ncbi:MAG: hypothetical protein JKY88_18785 [Pseudomonadales bacterium]|nr:hypothetical protein [Pseudomonadales bacterium]
MSTSFVTHQGSRYFWISLAFIILSIIIYAWHDPIPVPNGGTWYGYTLGTIGALMILWLLYLGKRKRNFAKGWGTTKGWVSAHVYFGSSLLVVATLHTGFQFGWNIHTLAYVLMCLVIFSGFFGVYAYVVYPNARNRVKKSRTRDDIFEQLQGVDQQLKKIVGDLPEEIGALVSSAIDRTEFGGGFLDQLRGNDKSKVMIDGVVVDNYNQDVVVENLVHKLTLAKGVETQMLAGLVKEYGVRQKLLGVIRTDIRLSAIQEIWLWFHVPMSFGLIAALAAHIVSVFIYW